ncbi:MAG: PilZ domain-containing protein [Spirochaetes bacterium]|nr:PilZ domain-containing protein [Spirochaetota bacterium]
MEELRQYPRYDCNIAVNFEYHEGNPDDFDLEKSMPAKGKGTIMDWSRGGMLIVSRARVSVGLPINLYFKSKKKENKLSGIIVRTGLILNNPSEVAQRIKTEKVKGDAYIGVKFYEVINELEY